MIFVRYESFRQYITMYRITSILLLINIILFLATLIFGYNSILWRMGVLIHGTPYHLELWRYILSMFLHAGFDHFLFNSFAIFIFAPPLEFMLGRSRYLLLYLGSGLLGNLFSMIVSSNTYTLSVGASGAIYGLYGAYLFLIFFRRHALDPASRKTVQIFLVIGIIYSFLADQINWAAHVGGLFGGYFIFSRIVSSFKRS